MTLNGHFTLSCHHYEQPLRIYFYILTVESVYTREERRCAEADRNPQYFWDCLEPTAYVFMVLHFGSIILPLR